MHCGVDAGVYSLIVPRSGRPRFRNELRHRSDPVRCADVSVQRVAPGDLFAFSTLQVNGRKRPF
jgi:hypothetical protein